jgi:UDP-N-acetylglucosamine pyrophosphorylase
MNATTISQKMRAAGESPSAVEAFLRHVATLKAGATGLIREKDIEAVGGLLHYRDLPDGDDPAWVARTAVIKLNGGLGTSMGLDRAKSLMPVKHGHTFLQLIARQLAGLAAAAGKPPHFFLLNSFSTSADTLAHLAESPVPGAPEALELRQSMVPKLDASSLEPVSWPRDPSLEWCPPGHGDIYPTLFGSGELDRLQAAGVDFLFVSNADNLGATLDLRILRYFAESSSPFMMEVAERTAADRKGGHLARRLSDGRLVLRESAQCAAEDEMLFQDTERHRFFNTNNLWIRVDALQSALRRNGGFLDLPLIVNRKTVDPRDKRSTPVLQLESAMGAAIELFDGSTALVTPRSRFAPVKTTGDLLVVRSDAYELGGDHALRPSPECADALPVVRLDDAYFKVIADFDARFPYGSPSMKRCRSLTVQGDWTFGDGVVFEGDVEMNTRSPRVLPAGTYQGSIGDASC